MHSLLVQYRSNMLREPVSLRVAIRTCIVVLCCPIMCLYVLSTMLWCSLRFPDKKRCSVRLYLQLFVGGIMSYLRYLYLFACSGVQHILCYVFVLLFVVLCTLCCQFLWTVLFWLPLRYSLTFIMLDVR